MASIFPPEWRGRALGLNVTAIYLGMTCGPFLGGMLTYHFGWRSLFILAGGMSLTAVLLFNWFIHGEWREAVGEKFDWVGGILVAVALGCTGCRQWSVIPARGGSADPQRINLRRDFSASAGAGTESPCST